MDSLGMRHFISSPLEHHAVLHPLEHFEKQGQAHIHLVKLLDNGDIDLDDLKEKVSVQKPAMVSLMHGNNEIGNILDVQRAARICKTAGALFHSDTVQTVGKLSIDLQAWDIDFINGSGHKFHGPKGVGFLYINSRNRIDPFLMGGAQERNMRGGTENVAGIVGLAAALELAIREQDVRREKIQDLKSYMKSQLLEYIPGVTFNGASGDLNKSLYHVLNVSFPEHRDNEMLLFSLDIEGICVSGGSACSSGTDIGSHVLTALGVPDERANIRFSFCEKNTPAEVDRVVEILRRILTSN
jgi:cysteine desulfurase